MSTLKSSDFKQEVMEILTQHESGLITDYEMSGRILQISANFCKDHVLDEIDENTGLRRIYEDLSCPTLK